MHSDIKWALCQLNRSYRLFEHNGKPMTKQEVELVLEYGISKGFKSTSELTDDIVNSILFGKGEI